MLTIGDLARETGVASQTIRHYESIGLMPDSVRSEGNQRRYDKAHLEILGFIKHARELGFSIEDIRELITLERQNSDSACGNIDAIVSHHLLGVRAKITALRRLEKELARMVENCPGDTLKSCRILATLHSYKHAHCLSDDHDGAALQEMPKRNKKSR
jgi:DNA-binding transcriptional MerR regulator